MRILRKSQRFKVFSKLFLIDFLRVFEDFSKNLKVIVLILTSKFEAF